MQPLPGFCLAHGLRIHILNNRMRAKRTVFFVMGETCEIQMCPQKIFIRDPITGGCFQAPLVEWTHNSPRAQNVSQALY